jgi:hypothetical protein
MAGKLESKYAPICVPLRLPSCLPAEQKRHACGHSTEQRMMHHVLHTFQALEEQQHCIATACTQSTGLKNCMHRESRALATAPYTLSTSIAVGAALPSAACGTPKPPAASVSDGGCRSPLVRLGNLTALLTRLLSRLGDRLC